MLDTLYGWLRCWLWWSIKQSIKSVFFTFAFSSFFHILHSFDTFKRNDFSGLLLKERAGVGRRIKKNFNGQLGFSTLTLIAPYIFSFTSRSCAPASLYSPGDYRHISANQTEQKYEPTDIFSTDTFRELIISIYKGRIPMRNSVEMPSKKVLPRQYHPLAQCYPAYLLNTWTRIHIHFLSASTHPKLYIFYGVFTCFIYSVAIDCDNNMFVGCSGMFHPRVLDLFSLCHKLAKGRRQTSNHTKQP